MSYTKVKILLDYWIMTRAGSALRRRHPNLRGLTAERLAICRRVGNGESVLGRELKVAMDCAFWFWLAFSTIELLLTLLLLLMAALFGLPAWRANSVVFSFFLGVWVFATSSFTFALVRSASFEDSMRARPGSRVRALAESVSRPRTRDSVISLLAATLGFLVALLNTL